MIPRTPLTGRPLGHLASRMALSLALLLAGCAGVPSTPAPTSEARATGEKSDAITPPVASPARPVQALPPVLPTGPLSAINADTSISPRQIAALSPPVDIWDRIRRGFAMPDLDNDIVREKEQWYASRPDYIQRMTDRSSRYLFHIVEELERRGLPSELALLPFIESAFNPQAVSSARAAGMWQFMPATGESFDLRQNVFRDDRRDVLASTKAALDYLEQLHQRFGDWHLALAAYNWGQGNVNRAITRNQKAGLPTDYDSLSMPLETRQYVPKLQAVKNIVAAPGQFQSRLPDIGNHPFFDAIGISKDIDVTLIAQLAEISESDFHALNPSIKQPVVMAAGTPQVLLPWDNANVFERKLADYEGPLASWTAWVVPSTMTAADAAKRVGMSEAELRQVNSIPARMKVRTGSSLLVRRSAQRNSDVSEYVADNARLSLQPETVWRRTTVRARKGDTLSSLAARYGVTVASITQQNKISRNAKLRTGQRIAILQPFNDSGKVRVTRASKEAASSAPSRSRKTSASRLKVKPTSSSRKAASSKAKKSATASAAIKKKKP